MDTFIDKFAQKRNAQEMIRANITAEAMKVEQLENQIRAYDGLMQEIRQVNLRTAENASEVQNALKECIEKLGAMQEEMQSKTEQIQDRQETEDQKTIAQIKEFLEEKFRQSDDFLHKENVKVYRNVQAAVIEELNKQTEEIKKSQEQNKTSKALLPVSIIILLGVITDIIIHLFSITIVF